MVDAELTDFPTFGRREHRRTFDGAASDRWLALDTPILLIISHLLVLASVATRRRTTSGGEQTTIGEGPTPRSCSANHFHHPENLLSFARLPRSARATRESGRDDRLVRPTPTKYNKVECAAESDPLRTAPVGFESRRRSSRRCQWSHARDIGSRQARPPPPATTARRVLSTSRTSLWPGPSSIPPPFGSFVRRGDTSRWGAEA